MNTMYVLMVNNVKCIAGMVPTSLQARHISSNIIRLTCSMFRMFVPSYIMKSYRKSILYCKETHASNTAGWQH
jgi:hypothetical protein